MITEEQLKNYYPFNKMEPQFRPLLLKQFTIHEFEMNHDIFQLDDNKIFAKYVIDGKVNITYPNGREKLLKSTSMQSYYPIGEVKTSKKIVSKVISKTAKIMMLNNIFLDHFTVWDNIFKDTPDTGPLRGHDSYDWVVGLLSSKAVQMLPRGHVDQLFKSLEQIKVSTGYEIITEGDTGDYCYIIANGNADVYKCVADGEDHIATLGAGDLFGENSLVSKEPRSASVRMKTDGVLMRMIGEKFSSLLKSHVVRWLTTTAAYEMISEGVVLLDVREEDEFQNLSFQGSIHIPMEKLRDVCRDKLNIKTPVITCSNTGMRCASAAFLLATLGYDVYSLQGGVNGLLKLVESQQV